MTLAEGKTIRYVVHHIIMAKETMLMSENV